MIEAGPVGSPSPGRMTARDDDHVTGAILFTDLVGFTEFTDEMGDRAALHVLEDQRRLVDAALAAPAPGRIVKELGDGLMIWFGDGEDGLEGARAVRAAYERARDDAGFPLAVRMGLHRGAAIRRGEDLVGQAVNVAARVCDLAAPGELLASDAALDGADGSGEPIGPARVKGVAEPVWLHRVA